MPVYLWNGKEYCLWLTNGMGCDVVNIGLCFYSYNRTCSTDGDAQGGIIITASHNPKQWNALNSLTKMENSLIKKRGTSLDIAVISRIWLCWVDNLGSYTERMWNTYNDKHINSVLALKLVDVEAISNKFQSCYRLCELSRRNNTSYFLTLGR